MAIKYHQFDNLPAAEAHLRALRAAGVLCHLLTLNGARHEVVELYARDAPPSAVDAYIGSLATATLEPLTGKPHSDGSHVTLDVRNVDPWSRNRGR